jgi:hypothetical protein
MKNFVNRYRLAFLAIAVLFVSESSFTRTRSDSPACSAPVKWMVPPKFTEGAIARWKDKELTGIVSLVVSEGGDLRHACCGRVSCLLLSCPARDPR